MGEVDDELFALLEETEKEDSKPKQETPFILPSQRKKQGARGSKKRKQPRQTKAAVADWEKLSDDDVEAGDPFMQAAIAMAPKATEATAKTPQPVILAPSSPVQRATVARQNTISAADAIEHLDNSVTTCIARAVEKVRQAFITELTEIFDNSVEERSIMNSFLISLPSEMETSIAAELALAKMTHHSERDSQRLNSIVDSHFEGLWRTIPQTTSTKTGPPPALHTISNDIAVSKHRLSQVIDDILRDIQYERSELIGARDQYAAVLERIGSYMQTTAMRKIEAEANSRRLDVEREYLDFRQKKLEEMKGEWADIRLGDEEAKESNEDILRELMGMANRAPRCKLREAIASLPTVGECAKRVREELHSVLAQWEVEVQSVSMKWEPIENVENWGNAITGDDRVRRRRPRIDVNRNRDVDILEQVRAEIQSLRRKRRRN
jgi:hypothetical protein